METKKRFKMYKSGKKWLVAAIVAGGMATAGSVVSAKADEVATANAPAQTPQTEQVQESTAAVTSATVKANSSAANSVSAASRKVNSSAAPTSATASSSVASTSVVNKAKDSQIAKNAVADDKKDINEFTAHNPEDSQKDVKNNDGTKESTKVTQDNKKDSGTVGTVKWTLDNQGTLHLNSGDLEHGRYDKNWNKNDVKVIQFDGEVTWNFETFGDYFFSEYENLTKIINADKLSFGSSETISFADNPQLKTIEGIEKWDTSHLTRLASVFQGDSSLNNLDLSKWDTSQVENMGIMFAQCRSLSNLNVKGWDVSKVHSFNSMFSMTTSLSDLDLSSWKNSAISEGHDYRSMFTGSGIEHLNLGGLYIDSNLDFTDSNYLKSVTVGPVTSNVYFVLRAGDDKKWKIESTGKTYTSDEIEDFLNKNGSDKAETYTLVTNDDNQPNNDKDDSHSNNSGQNDGKNDTNNNKPDQNNGKNNADSNQPAQNDGKNNAGSNASNANDVNNGKHANGDDTAANNAQATDANNQQNGGVIVDPNGSINNGNASDYAGAQSNAMFAPQDRANGQTRSKQSNQATAKTLPQTNEKKQSTTLLSVIGLAMLSLLAVVGLVKKQRKN
ncbi:BspA family leucine-rich repeat surface protein [Pediococcus acidilactici]|uniref:BspA family leucine-rich repeat surface protein n=1 Tax=Pediococcus acidilactici TaxID=1254 RepID=UPI00325C9B94